MGRLGAGIDECLVFCMLERVGFKLFRKARR